MSKSESSTRGRLCKILCKLGLDGVAVENPARPGTPDVNYRDGWIEVKRTKAWPKSDCTPVRLDHELMPSQKVWLRRRARAGGTVWVFLHIDRDLLLIDATEYLTWAGTATQAQLKRSAAVCASSWSELETSLKELLCSPTQPRSATT